MNNKNTNDTSWMDEQDPLVDKNCLTCHIEIDIESEETYRDIIAKAVAGLRATALQLEQGKLDDGHEPIKTIKGEQIGTVYIDYSGISYT